MGCWKRNCEPTIWSWYGLDLFGILVHFNSFQKDIPPWIPFNLTWFLNISRNHHALAGAPLGLKAFEIGSRAHSAVPKLRHHVRDVEIQMQSNLTYQIKATEGITGFSYWIAHIKWMTWHLDVELSFPKSVGVHYWWECSSQVDLGIFSWAVFQFRSTSPTCTLMMATGFYWGLGIFN